MLFVLIQIIYPDETRLVFPSGAFIGCLHRISPLSTASFLLPLASFLLPSGFFNRYLRRISPPPTASFLPSGSFDGYLCRRYPRPSNISALAGSFDGCLCRISPLPSDISGSIECFRQLGFHWVPSMSASIGYLHPQRLVFFSQRLVFFSQRLVFFHNGYFSSIEGTHFH